MNVALTPEMERFVEAEVGAGRFSDTSAMIDAALKLLKHGRLSPPWSPQTKGELVAALRDSNESINRGEGVPFEEFFERFENSIRGPALPK